MPLAAALDARGRGRIAAAAIAAALQVAFYRLMVQQAVEPTVLPSRMPLEIAILQTAGRPRPATLPQKHRLEPPRLLTVPEAVPPPAEIIEPITPTRVRAPGAHAPIDWQQAIQGEVRSLDTPSRARELPFGFPQRPAAGPAASPEFGWDYAHTHRVEALPEGGLLINLTDRCALVAYVLLIPVCRIGRMPPNGQLFAHMRDRSTEPHGGLP